MAPENGSHEPADGSQVHPRYKETPAHAGVSLSAPGATRTPNLLIRSPETAVLMNSHSSRFVAFTKECRPPVFSVDPV